MDEKSSFSKSYQLIWNCAGNGLLTINGCTINLQSDTLVFIPVSSTYTIIPHQELNIVKIYLPSKYLEINNTTQHNLLNVNIPIIKRSLATYLYRYNRRSDFNIENESIDLINQLLHYSEPSDTTVIPVQDPRVLNALQYIDENLKTRFTVNDIATKLHVNPTYLSTLFHHQVGTTIVKYTNTLRLEGAIHDIQNNTMSITQIAYNHGFADVRTLNELTKARYQITPMQIRNKSKTIDNTIVNDNPFQALINNYRDITKDLPDKELSINADAMVTTGSYKTSFNTIAIGRAHDILYSTVQTQLVTAKQTLDFKYCRFHNIFGDEMNIIDTDYHGHITFNFSKPIQVIEFLLQNDVLPFIELGFFPKEIANESLSSFTGYNVNVGGNINFELWEQMIEQFFTLLIQLFPDKYLQMRYDFWNEIDIKAFWPNSKSDLFKLYTVTYRTIKNLDPNIQLGGFSYGNFVDKFDNIYTDLDYLQAHNLLPDFLSIHSYPLYVDTNISHNPDLVASEIKATYIKDKLNRDINLLVTLKQQYQFKEVYITEWNTSPMQRESLNDSIHKSSKIISEVLNSNSSQIDGICYWTLSDEMAEFGYPLNEVHGGFGLFTRRGIPKPAYYGYLFSSKLQGQVIYKDYNTLILDDDDKYLFLLNNDVDYERNYYDLSFNPNPQTMEGNKIRSELNLTSIESGTYLLDKYEITQQLDLNDNFKRLYSNNRHLLDSQLNVLKSLSKLIKSSQILSLDNTFTTTVELDSRCTTLIVLRKT